MEKDIVIGAGEVGRALHTILSKKYEMILKDREEIPVEPIRVMNICIPYNDSFISQVEFYIEKWNPRIVIIHSTVEIGTSDKLENLIAPIVYSPVRGRHPRMEEGLQTYEKIIGTKYLKDAENVQKYFEQAGIPSKIYPDARNAEAAKLMCTTYYGWNIIFAKELKKFCEEKGLDFNYVYTDFTQSYNAHVAPQWRKAIIYPKPGKIGGHCVIPNAVILKGWDVADFITKKNETYEDSI